jgi:hypothetical protein
MSRSKNSWCHHSAVCTTHLKPPIWSLIYRQKQSTFTIAHLLPSREVDKTLAAVLRACAISSQSSIGQSSPVAKLIHSATSFTVIDERREHDQRGRIALTQIYWGFALPSRHSELFASWLLAFDLGAWRLCHQPAI